MKLMLLCLTTVITTTLITVTTCLFSLHLWLRTATRLTCVGRTTCTVTMMRRHICPLRNEKWLWWVRYPKEIDMEMIAYFETDLGEENHWLNSGFLAKIEEILTCEQYRHKSSVHQIIANHNTRYSEKKLLKYWLRKRNNGPIRPQSKYSISLFVIWATYW